MRVLELLILIRLPLLKQGRRRVLVEKVGGQCAFKGAAEEHGCPRVFLLPAIQIAMTVAARTGQVLADLSIAVDHQATSDPRESSAAVGESSFQRLSGAKPSRLAPGHRFHLFPAARCRSRSRAGTRSTSTLLLPCSKGGR